MAMTQGDAVFTAVNNVLGGEINGAVTLNETQKKEVIAAVFAMFKSGETTHKSNPDDAALLKYIPGLVNNWVRKDPRLNGNTKYQTKKPGSRAGSEDEQLKAMRALRSSTTDAEAIKQIDAAIAARVAELKPKTVVNIEALPESLRKFVAQQ